MVAFGFMKENSIQRKAKRQSIKDAGLAFLNDLLER